MKANVEKGGKDGQQSITQEKEKIQKDHKYFIIIEFHFRNISIHNQISKFIFVHINFTSVQTL